MYTDEAVEKLVELFESESEFAKGRTDASTSSFYEGRYNQATFTLGCIKRWARNNRQPDPEPRGKMRVFVEALPTDPKLDDALARIATLETTLATIAPHVEEIVRAFAVYESEAQK